MTASKLQSGLPSVDYYAPNYQIEVEGEEIDPTTKGDVLQLKVTMEKKNLTSFNLTVNNWDDRNFRFKYSDGDTFFINRRIHIKMGYADRLVSMVRGQITSMSPKFPQSGAPTMDVGGTDRLFMLKNSKPNDGDPLSYTNQADWQIAQAVAARNQLPIDVTQEGPVHELVVQQKDQDDARFLLDRASRIDFDVYMQTDPESGGDKLFFVKPKDGRDSQPIRVYRFEWGKSLVSYTPRLKVSDQVSSVTVRGWNPRTKEPIVATATADDLPQTEGSGGNGPSAAQDTASGGSGKQEFIVNAAVISEEEAKRLAVSRLVERAYTYNTGSGQVIGLPDLRPGDNVDLLGLGTRFSGRYQVEKVEHSLGSSGYMTQFDVKKLRDGGD
jgi:phage protein D